MKLKNRLLFICLSMVLLSTVMISVAIFSYLGFHLHRVESQYGTSDPNYQTVVQPLKQMWNTPQTRELLIDLAIMVILALCVVAIAVALWLYWSIVDPLKKVQIATDNIKNGNLDFEMNINSKDEIGELYADFESMRKRLKDNAEEKIEADKRDREFISNISHDLKTPLTSIRGYCEGIMDGVASTPEKMDKYIRTI